MLTSFHSLQGLSRRHYRRWWRSETALMLALAVLVGLGGGYGAVAFRWLSQGIRVFFTEQPGQWLGYVGASSQALPYVLVIAPALGGLAVGLLTSRLAPETRGPGVAPVMEALALRAGRIRPIVIAVKPLATALTLGSGGSGGREGPIVHMGSAIGSLLGQIVELPDEQRKNLVACGAAAGIAATFNAPLAGVMFALEVLLASFGLRQFTNVVVAAVIDSLIVSVRRDARVLVPRGDTCLQPGDVVIALAREGKERALRRRLLGDRTSSQSSRQAA